jgi:hypothetical protein
MIFQGMLRGSAVIAGRLAAEAAFCLAVDGFDAIEGLDSGSRSSFAEATATERLESVSRLRRWSSARKSEACW